MQNDFTPRRGAVRSISRPPAARPLVVTQRPAARPVAVVTETFASTLPAVKPADSLPPPLPVQPVMVSVPVERVMPATLESLPTPFHDIVQPPKQSQPMISSAAELPVETPPRPVPVAVAPKPPVVAPVAESLKQDKVQKPVKSKRKFLRHRPTKRSLIIASAIALILAVAGYFAFTAWQANGKQVIPVVPVAAAKSSTEHVQASEGTEVTPLPKNTLASYKVAADVPRAIRIQKLGVEARVMPMGVNKDGSMQAPLNINDSGWYTGSAKPGAAGAMVLDGHSSATNSAEHLGLFNAIHTLENGDTMTIEKGDGTILTYKVVYKETVKLADIDMKKALLPYGTATEGLNLITCAGQWTDKNATLDHRTVVYTERITS